MPNNRNQHCQKFKFWFKKNKNKSINKITIYLYLPIGSFFTINFSSTFTFETIFITSLKTKTKFVIKFNKIIGCKFTLNRLYYRLSLIL